MISPSFFVSARFFKKKKKLTKGWTFYFPPFFFYFLISLQVWLQSGQGEVYYLLVPLFFFTGDWSPPALGSILTRSSCFVSRIFLILLMQTELLSSAVHRALGSRAWTGQLFPSSFFFFFWTSPRSWKKRPEKSIKSMNGFPSKTHAFKGETERDTGGWRVENVLGVDGQSCWNEIMRNWISEQIRSDVKIVPCIWAASKRKEERRKSDGGRLRRRCGGLFFFQSGCYWSLSL